MGVECILAAIWHRGTCNMKTPSPTMPPHMPPLTRHVDLLGPRQACVGGVVEHLHRLPRLRHLRLG
eukprot:7280773-Pyramimonas_sp.AAC.1